VLGSKIRVGVLGLVAILLVGSYAATAASANPGPFCYWKLSSEKGTNKGKITEAEPKTVQGEGGQQTLSGSGATITAGSLQIKGIIYNNKEQCQAKLALTYHELKLNGETEEECKVTVGTNNTVNVFGHQDWKYRGNSEELTVQPQKKLQTRDWLFLHGNLNTEKEELKELPKEIFTTLTFMGKTGGKCKVFGGLKVNVEGNAGVVPIPAGIEEFRTEEEFLLTKGELWQHDWSSFSKGYIPFKTGLIFNSAAASLTGASKVKPEESGIEIAFFEGP
jgi:hypothetical protein